MNYDEAWDPPLPDRYRRGIAMARDAVVDALPAGTSASRRERLSATVVALTDELAKLAGRPDEPTGADVVVRFRRRFPGSRRRYAYVAIKVGDSWYLSGTNQGGKRYSWDALLDFVYQDPDAPKTLRVATRWQRLVEGG